MGTRRAAAPHQPPAVTACATWSVFCDGNGKEELRCGAWIGKEDSKFAARALAKQLGWATGKRDLCPRCSREEKER
jgi:hypothetical protein